MVGKTYGAYPDGIDGQLVTVECDTSNGLPTTSIIGLTSRSVDESRDRIRSAIKNSNLKYPRQKLVVNLAPADVSKSGTGYDLAVAIAILLADGQIDNPLVKGTVFAGELSLDGQLKGIQNVFPFLIAARQHGLKRVIIPADNAEHAGIIHGIEVLAAKSLSDVYAYLRGQKALTKVAPTNLQSNSLAVDLSAPTLESISGQSAAKRALTIAVAGWHNIHLTGPPGTGKSMLANSLRTILPPLSVDEIIKLNRIYALSEFITTPIVSRPVRSPHHTASTVAVIGGGQPAKPGEATLAHTGVLFLDELPEFSRQTLEALRQPLEDRSISLSRANSKLSLPADFLLVATSNPCPCGYYGMDSSRCKCSAIDIKRYSSKLSGPLKDRIDMLCKVERFSSKKILSARHNADTLTTSDAVEMIKQSRLRQTKRFEGSVFQTNSQLDADFIRSEQLLLPEAKKLLDSAGDKLSLSPRSYIRTVRVAQTIADIDEVKKIAIPHVSEALFYRYSDA